MVGRTDTPREMHGLPVYELGAPIDFAISEKDVRGGVAFDCDRCGIALAAKNQLQVPIAHIGSSHAYIAVPNKEKGRLYEGYGETKFVIVAAILGKAAQRLMRAVDSGDADAVGQVVTLIPRKRAEHPGEKAKRRFKTNGTTKKEERVSIALKEEGHRNYSGRGWA